MRIISFLTVLAAITFTCSAQAGEIRLNQVGFYPAGPKTAVVVDEGAIGDAFYVVSQESSDTVYAGVLAAPEEWELSGETVRLADFSAITTPGSYVVHVPGTEPSYPFLIAPRVHGPVARAAVKAFYFQRASTPLLPEHAGKWARKAGHADDHVLIHPSAASPARPEGSTIAAPRGWYDAGDYNKYIVNSGITTATLLALYENFPDYAAALELNIPESGNGVPDLLDEILWNLRWMLAMQDPADGGVYTKLTTARFEGFVNPEEAQAPRYVVQKSTPAALDFAAVAAQAARVYAPFSDVYPGLADSARSAAVAAWNWARTHPDVRYNQGAMNREFEPDVVTGGYGDRDISDEFAWAAAELFVTTGDPAYLQEVTLFPDEGMPIPTWSQVLPLAYYTLARHSGTIPVPADVIAGVRQRILDQANRLVESAETSPYNVPMGSSRRDFVWGSNSFAANQGVLLIQAYRMSGDRDYLDRAIDNLDYILGRNATGYSFVTGIGSKTPMFPHHRPSGADGIDEPVPGFLSGGPNPGQQDGCNYTASEPARSFVDEECSYASNEIAINWNAPLAYLASAIEALHVEAGLAEMSGQ